MLQQIILLLKMWNTRILKKSLFDSGIEISHISLLYCSGIYVSDITGSLLELLKYLG
jgi:hypothetical protein